MAEGLHGFTIDSSDPACGPGSGCRTTWRPAPTAVARSSIPMTAFCLSVHELHRLRPAVLHHRGPAGSNRPRTSMRRFVMCAACRAEYRSPDDRRFHAQPVACGRCGPRTILRGCDGRQEANGADALAVAIGLIREGKVVAVKGVGGFQLLVLADRSEPVTLLLRKGRPTKPLAVMVSSIEDAARLGVVGPMERRLLTSPENPIVLLDAGIPAGAAVGSRRGRTRAIEPRCSAHDPVASPPARRARFPGGRHQRQPGRRADCHERMGCKTAARRSTSKACPLNSNW